MDFSAQLDALSTRATQLAEAARSATGETRTQIRQRLDQARVDLDLAGKDLQDAAEGAAGTAGAMWSRVRSDASSAFDSLRASIEERVGRADASRAKADAEQAESNAREAIAYAKRALDAATLAVLDAIDARRDADDDATDD